MILLYQTAITYLMNAYQASYYGEEQIIAYVTEQIEKEQCNLILESVGYGTGYEPCWDRLENAFQD